MEDLIIINAGKFGREVLAWAQDAIRAGAQWRIKGFLDGRPDALKGIDCGAAIIGTAGDYVPQQNDVFLPALGDPQSKQQYCRPILEKGGRFANLIHPTANIGPRVKLGRGIILAPFTSLTCDLEIGDFVTFGVFSGAGHDTRIDDWCQLSGHCGVNGNAVLEEGAFLGSHACILPGAKVGAWAFVGAGSVVLRRVAAGAKVFGNPAVEIGR